MSGALASASVRRSVTFRVPNKSSLTVCDTACQQQQQVHEDFLQRTAVTVTCPSFRASFFCLSSSQENRRSPDRGGAAASRFFVREGPPPRREPTPEGSRRMPTGGLQHPRGVLQKIRELILVIREEGGGTGFAYCCTNLSHCVDFSIS